MNDHSGNNGDHAPLKIEDAQVPDIFDRYLKNHLGHYASFEPYYLYEALALTMRDSIMPQWYETWKRHNEPDTRHAYYLSLEFLIGRALGNHILNLDLDDGAKQALMKYSSDLEELIESEPDAGLGNGGLGRLAACFMDSCATLNLPVRGYGIRYEFGMFKQFIRDGHQVEEPDHWLQYENPWEIARLEYVQTIHFGGHTESTGDKADRRKGVNWVETNDIVAIPHDMPITGYRNGSVNTLRLWKASACDVFNLEEFNAGSYSDAVQAQNDAEHISMVLYPNDASESGKELRLKQQYFLVSASLQDVIRNWEENYGNDYSRFAELKVFQLNDTHPSIAVAELMRILVDEKGVDWDEAWNITTSCMAYTNHTLLPEALETWPVALMERLLPRPMEIIYEINKSFLKIIAQKWPGDADRLSRMSLIDEGNGKRVRMAYLAIVGSFSVNGVAALHSRLLSTGLFKDFYELWPERFNNKTNGVTPRRWVAFANPGLSQLITENIGDGWIADLSQLSRLNERVDTNDETFMQRWRDVKKQNKQRLAEMVEKECGVTFDTDAMFDVQVKRIHEYKRQLLNVLHVIHLYRRIKNGDTAGMVPRCVLIGGKAAPGYYMAKLIIKLVNNVAATINSDPEVSPLLKLVFLPNYNVSRMETICAAADLSEQISTAGKEASGTGNMKFMMNGAVTIGTYDGANIEIMDAVGEENFVLFGLKADEVEATRGSYNPQAIIDSDEDVAGVMQMLESSQFNLMESHLFDDIINSIKSPHDPWMTLADLRSYIDAQQTVADLYSDQDTWTRMSIRNTANSGFFSTDRTMEQYNEDIWKLK